MPREPKARALLFFSLALGLALRALAAFTDDGIYWPDEIYQSFEPAHWVVFGHGLKPWEFIEGARNWTLAGFVAVVMKVCAVLGGDSPQVYVRVVKLVFAIASASAGWGVYRLARAYEAPELAAAAGASLWALAAPAIYFGFRAMSENASAVAIVWGLALVLDRNASRKVLVAGASLLGLAVLFRLQVGLICAAALAVLIARAPRRGNWWVVLAALVAWAVVYGATDAIAWHDAPGARAGGWFHSVVVYLRFNLSGRAEHWSTSFFAAGWTFFAKTLWSSMPAVIGVAVLGALASLRRAPGLFFVAALFFVLHCLVPHKEYRFILPMLPLLFALAGIGLSLVPAKSLPVAALVMALVGGASAYNRGSLTFADLGSYPELPPDYSAWDDYGPLNRLMLVASRQPDLCGLRIDPYHAGAVGLAWTGGSTYLHKKAPIYPPGFPHNLGYFNYVITRPGSGAEVIAREKDLELVRIPGMSTCQPNPGYTWHLG